MILRKLATSLKKRDWGAAVIEVGIVVLGIFIGLQVDTWQRNNADRAKERELLRRLHAEIVTLIATRKEEVAGPLQRYKYLLSLQERLLTDQPTETMSDQQCLAIALSHIFRRPPDKLPTLDEMLATGSTGLASNAQIRAKLIQFIQIKDRARSVHQELTAAPFKLTVMYPDLFDQTLLPRGDDDAGGTVDLFSFGEVVPQAYTPIIRCDLAAMKQNRAFQSALFDNLGRTNAYLQGTFQPVDGSLMALEAALRDHLKLGSAQP